MTALGAVSQNSAAAGALLRFVVAEEVQADALLWPTH